MFVLYAVLAGLILGQLVGGHAGRLGAIRFQWSGLVAVGMVTQVALFSDPVATRIGELGPPLYVASTGLVLLAVLRNLAIPGLQLVAAGAASNLAAIVANGGYMPASPAAVGGHLSHQAAGYSNSVVLANPVLAPLTDVFALPAWVPWANVFSVPGFRARNAIATPTNDAKTLFFVISSVLKDQFGNSSITIIRKPDMVNCGRRTCERALMYYNEK